MSEKKLKVYCETSFDDPMDEIYAMRHKVAEKYDYSLDRIFEAAAARQREDEAKGMVLHSLADSPAHANAMSVWS